ncbi:arginine decarboxylase, pyruvoyl-dependent [Aliifodinibius sp. S!AR15-10]|uniref:pyruvoyl-dependent arginine decarboxylase n=1 Tax=Aliifodinibius sp. S!AR15-10 TaxID=2950437 RepID=UPI0028581EDF|nr:arginine decarboxylase, pyruvoyl-dependent [Aliifodinibius sp. S!AR15-10]MDR8391567.1 arginine decarboxylase, pyruvoyl-dependent [Aliifodinibius sp. S!AR15-10]
MEEPSELNIAEQLMVKTPNVFCLVKGASEGRTRLNAFDNALLNAGVGDTNLIRMSSILPPGAQQRTIDDLDLPKGGLIPLAYATIDSTTPGRYISSAIAVGIPEDDSEPGVIMEFEDHSKLENVEDIVQQMVIDAFDYRNRALKEIKSIGIEHKVETCGSTFAAAVLWYE